MENTENKIPEIIVLKFADSRIPVFKESRDKEYIKYGEDNAYPEYLTYLFNKSAKHNAILTGKANYIFGKGYENGNMPVNRLGETLNDIARKCILDTEIYGGFRLEVIWNRARRISEIYHVDYSTIRLGKDDGYYFCEKWEKWRNDPEYIPSFNPGQPFGSQIYAYNEYRPGVRFYPLPSYIGCNNYVETDIEISKFYLSAIRNGMMPSKMIQFFKGEPTEDKKREIEKRMGAKFAGSENAGHFMLVFHDANSVNQTVKVDDLSGTELDKMFIELNKTTQQEIYAGHGVTSPMLFGIKTEGQLGGSGELKTAYEIFVNTYAEPKGDAFDREMNHLLGFSAFVGKYELTQTDPIGLQFDVKDIIADIPKTFIFERLGVPKEYWPADITQPTLPGATAPGEMVNDNIKNLTAKQHQQLMRIIRQYGKGQLTEQQAKTMLRTGLGLSDADINAILGIEVKMSAEPESEDNVIAMFDACGDNKDDYEVIKSKMVCFSVDEQEEELWMQEAFKTYDITVSENAILELIKKDSKITVDVIASTIKQTKAYVESKIGSLTKRGYLESSTEMIGSDEVIVRTVPKVTINTPPPGKINPAMISIKYSYEPKPGLEPIIETTRPFCKKMIELNRIYSRAEIERISERLGYSVFDRKGGFWGKSPECRHRWVSHIVVKKGGQQS